MAPEQTIVINFISVIAQSHLDTVWPAALLPLSCSAHTHLVVSLLHCILCRLKVYLFWVEVYHTFLEIIVELILALP